MYKRGKDIFQVLPSRSKNASDSPMKRLKEEFFIEETFGPGGYNAVRGHGGINARVLKSGVIRIDDSVVYYV